MKKHEDVVQRLPKYYYCSEVQANTIYPRFVFTNILPNTYIIAKRLWSHYLLAWMVKERQNQ